MYDNKRASGTFILGELTIQVIRNENIVHKIAALFIDLVYTSRFLGYLLLKFVYTSYFFKTNRYYFLVTTPIIKWPNEGK